MFAIALTSWPAYARLARAETLTMRGTDYIAAMRLTGAWSGRIILRHIMPLCLSCVIVRVTLDMSGIILTAAGSGLPRHGRAAADAGVGHHDRLVACLHPGAVVGADDPWPRHLRRVAGIQPAGRRHARRAGSEATLTATAGPDRKSAHPLPDAKRLSEAVRNVSLTLGQEKLGIVGESGSGKSLTARAILRLLPATARGHRRQVDLRRYRRAARRERRCAASAASERA